MEALAKEQQKEFNISTTAKILFGALRDSKDKYIEPCRQQFFGENARFIATKIIAGKYHE